MKSNRLKHLYVEELKDLYSAENQLVKALPKMAEASTSPDLAGRLRRTPGPDQGTRRTPGKDIQSARRKPHWKEVQGNGGAD